MVVKQDSSSVAVNVRTWGRFCKSGRFGAASVVARNLFLQAGAAVILPAGRPEARARIRSKGHGPAGFPRGRGIVPVGPVPVSTVPRGADRRETPSAPVSFAHSSVGPSWTHARAVATSWAVRNRPEAAYIGPHIRLALLHAPRWAIQTHHAPSAAQMSIRCTSVEGRVCTTPCTRISSQRGKISRLWPRLLWSSACGATAHAIRALSAPWRSATRRTTGLLCSKRHWNVRSTTGSFHRGRARAAGSV